MRKKLRVKRQESGVWSLESKNQIPNPRLFTCVSKKSQILNLIFCLLSSVFCLLFLGCDKSYKEPSNSNFILSPLTRITDDKAIDNFCSVSPNGQYIALSSNKQGNFDIYIKDVNEKATTQRTFGKEGDIFPSFSPDGKRIAYSSNRFGSFDIFMMDAEKGGQIQQITFDNKRDEFFSDFSPNGNKIIFTSLSKEGIAIIMMIDLKTGLLTEITRGFFGRFSRDGEAILFNRQKENDINIWMVNIDGGNKRLIFHNEEFNSWFPSFSPSGERIVYTSCPKGKMKFKWDKIDDKDLKMDIRCVDIRGMNDTRMTGDEGIDCFPCWSNDGFVYFSSLRNENVDIFRVSQPEEIVQSQESRVKSQESRVQQNLQVFKEEEKIKVRKKFPKPKEPSLKTEVVTIRDNVSIWSYPGKTIIANVDRGIKLYVIDSSKKWYIKVLLPDGRIGWVSSYFVELN